MFGMRPYGCLQALLNWRKCMRQLLERLLYLLAQVHGQKPADDSEWSLAHPFVLETLCTLLVSSSYQTNSWSAGPRWAWRDVRARRAAKNRFKHRWIKGHGLCPASLRLSFDRVFKAPFEHICIECFEARLTFPCTLAFPRLVYGLRFTLDMYSAKTNIVGHSLCPNPAFWTLCRDSTRNVNT